MTVIFNCHFIILISQSNKSQTKFFFIQAMLANIKYYRIHKLCTLHMYKHKVIKLNYYLKKIINAKNRIDHSKFTIL